MMTEVIDVHVRHQCLTPQWVNIWSHMLSNHTVICLFLVLVWSLHPKIYLLVDVHGYLRLSLCVCSHNITNHKIKEHYIDNITSHYITSHITSHHTKCDHITSPHITQMWKLRGTARLLSAGGRFKNAYELLSLSALKFSFVNKKHIFQSMDKIFCVEFLRVPLRFHTKYLTHTLKDTIFIQSWNPHKGYSP